MSEWLHNRGNQMNELTHKRARMLIQGETLSLLERSALANHLAGCEQCGRYAAVHQHLLRSLHLEPVRTTIAPEQRTALMERVRSQHRRAQIMKPVYALTGVAILAVVIVVAWLTIGTLAQEDVTEPVPPTVISVSPTVQSTLPPTEMPSAATAEPTEQPTAAPTATSDPTLAYQSYEVGDEIFDLAVADFNGDAMPDIAMADYGQGATHVMLNDGTGNYPEATTYDTGEGSISLSAADLNGDSIIDLAISSDVTERIIILTNSGDGTFLEPVFYAAGPPPSWVQAGDLDGDSFIDLAIAHEPDWVGVMYNNGDGTFRESEQYFVGDGAGYGSAHVGDLNGDGHLDLAVRHMPDGLVSVLMNNGDGTFGEPVSYEVGFNPMWMTMGDLNQDDALDLLIPAESGVVSILYNVGDGSFQESVDLETGGSTRDVKIAELDGDGLPDLVVAPTGSGIVTTYSNNGDGSFRKLEDYYYQSAFLLAFFVTDVEVDGQRDLVGIGGGSSVYVIPFEPSE